MAIHRRDRQFQSIIDDIEVETIPLRFIRDITCYLEDGREVLIDQDTLQKHEDDHTCIESFIAHLDFSDALTDLNIRIDFGKVEKDVDVQLASILKKLHGNKGNTSN